MSEEMRAVYPYEQGFIIDNDSKADWAVRTIREAQAERDRLLALAEQRIAELTEQMEGIRERCIRNTEHLMQQLGQYMGMVKTKQTKTQETYQLLSGKLVHKYGGYDYKRDDQQVIAWCMANGRGSMVKVKEELDWAELKKTLTVQDDMAVTEDGEIIPGIVVEHKPDRFDIKF